MELTDEILQHLSGSMDELGQKIENTIDEELAKKSIACQIMDLKEWDVALTSKDPKTLDLYILESTSQNKSKREVSPILVDPSEAPTAQFMEAPERYVIPIGTFSSSRYWRTLAHIKTDSIPWTGRALADMVRNGIVNSIDTKFTELVQTSVKITEQTVACPDLVPSRTAIISAMQSVMGNSYASKLLIRKDDFLAMLKLSESLGINLEIDASTEFVIDNDITYETCVIENILHQGAEAKCEGMKIVLCHDDDILQPGHMYVFAMPEDIGKLYLGDTRFEMEKRFQVLQWEGSATGGMNIADVYSIAEIVVNRSIEQIPPITKHFLENPPESPHSGHKNVVKRQGFFRKLFRTITRKETA